MFLVNNDETKILERQKHTGTNTQNQLVRLAGGLTFVHIQSLHIGEFRVIDSHTIPKELSKTLCDLGGQRDFREEVKHLLALLQVFVNEMDINLRLAR